MVENYSWIGSVEGAGSDLVSDQHDQVATAPCTDPIQVRFYFWGKAVVETEP